MATAGGRRAPEAEEAGGERQGGGGEEGGAEHAAERVALGPAAGEEVVEQHQVAGRDGEAAGRGAEPALDASGSARR